MKSSAVSPSNVAEIKREFRSLNATYIKNGVPMSSLRKHQACHNHRTALTLAAAVVLLFSILYATNVFDEIISYALGIRCLVPNNYFVWEATRPISDCRYCLNVTAPIVLFNATRDEFAPHAYSSKPIVVKRAVAHWPAFETFDFYFFKELYERIDDSIRSVSEECQFLHFQSNFISLTDVFNMSPERVRNDVGEKSWYVGWGNCHPDVLRELRRHYPKPHFLPEDCEIPAKEYVFMGYDEGATLHLDFISRLMWQAQLKGSKTWKLLPSNECEDVCSSIEFSVEPGDAVLVDTRIWYHGTTISPGEFSLSIQSEYG